MRESNQPNPNRAPWVSDTAKPDSFDTAMNPAPYDPHDSAHQHSKANKRGLGCWVWGCLGVIVFMLIAIIGIGVASYFIYMAQVEKYTDTQPSDLPVVEMEADELEALEKRIESFTNQVRSRAEAATETDTATDNGAKTDAEATTDDSSESEAASAELGNLPDQDPAKAPVRELVLTAEEINGLIASKPEMKGHVFVEIEDGIVSGEVSFPTDMIPGASGRFFNADAEFDVSLVDGLLVVRLTDARVKGERVPQPLLDGFSRNNLAEELYNDPKNAEMLRKFDSIEVVDDSIVLRLKEPEATEPEPIPESELDPEPTLDAESESGVRPAF